MTKGGNTSSHSFSIRCGSQPPPLRGTSFQRKEGECAQNRATIPHASSSGCSLSEEGGRIPPFLQQSLFPVSSFRAKARNLFRSRSGKAVREAENGKHRASCDWGVRCFMQTALRRKTETGNEKDLSATLGMTKRGSTSHIRFQSTAEANLRPFGAPPSKGRRESARNRAAISCTAPFYFAWPAAGIGTAPRIHLFLLRHRQNTATDSEKKQPLGCFFT